MKKLLKGCTGVLLLALPCAGPVAAAPVEPGRGGGTDAAFAAMSGKAAVVESFGLAGFNYHSSEAEYVDLDSIEPRLYLLLRLVMDTARGR